MASSRLHDAILRLQRLCIEPGQLHEGLLQSQPWPGGGKREPRSLVGHLLVPQHLFGEMREQLFHQLHQIPVIGIGLIEL